MGLTLYGKMHKELINNGMFDTQAKKVMRKVMEEQKELIGGRWQDSASDYPEATVNTLWLSVKMSALEWINENAPQAWFKPMFE